VVIMKLLLMGTHFDGLTLPKGVERYPHAHKWRVHANPTPKDKLGRPYCTECGGMPCWYSLEEPRSAYSCNSLIKSGLSILVERDDIQTDRFEYEK
jgi:hypothetical protein